MACLIRCEASRRYQTEMRQADRLAAHAKASHRSNGARDAGCRMLMGFTERCVAVAQAWRLKGILLTDHPSTYEVAAISIGTGPSQAAAEAAALAQCRGRGSQAACRIATAACVR